MSFFLSPSPQRRSAALALTVALSVLAWPGLANAATSATPGATVTSPTTSPSVSVSSGSLSPSPSHTPKPVVSPFAGPLATPCPPAADTHPTPAVTDPPSSVPTTPADGPIGGPEMGSTGIVVTGGAGVPPVPDITASSWVIADADTGEILAAKDPHGLYRPASTLKTLTAVTLIPRLDPCAIYVAKNADLHAECTCAGVVDGVAYRVKMLLTGMLVVSGNDAADTLAGAYGGIGKTVAAMNAEAKYLKAYDTTAGTPSGLDTPTERSSAYDLALIARAGLAMPDFRGYVGTRHAQFTLPKGGTQTLITHDKLLANYNGAIGIKNGYTLAAQATYIGAATRGGHTIIATLMHSTVGTAVWHEAAALMDWGFAAEGKATPVGQLVDPDLPPLPSAPASSASSAAAVVTSTSTSSAAALVAKTTVKAIAARKASTAGGSVAVPVTVAVALVVIASAVLTSLQRRRRRRMSTLERALRF
jgi:serine-type D-Ala-D-Ala carboxypeptidase (penicillin-binding protein 5/6)